MAKNQEKFIFWVLISNKLDFFGLKLEKGNFWSFFLHKNSHFWVLAICQFSSDFDFCFGDFGYFYLYLQHTWGQQNCGPLGVRSPTSHPIRCVYVRWGTILISKFGEWEGDWNAQHIPLQFQLNWCHKYNFPLIYLWPVKL